MPAKSRKKRNHIRTNPLYIEPVLQLSQLLVSSLKYRLEPYFEVPRFTTFSFEGGSSGVYGGTEHAGHIAGLVLQRVNQQHVTSKITQVYVKPNYKEKTISIT